MLIFRELQKQCHYMLRWPFRVLKLRIKVQKQTYIYCSFNANYEENSKIGTGMTQILHRKKLKHDKEDEICQDFGNLSKR